MRKTAIGESGRENFTENFTERETEREREGEDHLTVREKEGER